MMLGNFDENTDLDEYKKVVKDLTLVQGENVDTSKLRGEGEWVEYKPATDKEMKVREVQQFLKDAGFFPYGRIDGICGYRTTSAIRLFQEYVRTVEKDTSIGYPDGIIGPIAFSHIKRWKNEGKKADWIKFSAASPSSEYAQWLELLQKTNAHYVANPTETMQRVEKFAVAKGLDKKGFAQLCDTVRVADWDFDSNNIHLIGIRHPKEAQQGDSKQVLDDVFVLLMQGLVFKFYGSTEPGVKKGKEYPFLVRGQHRYRFSWHHLVDEPGKLFQALKPKGKGVLVMRSENLIPSDADLSLDEKPNTTINIHWGGKGLSNSAGWSAGCQVIAGQSYINHSNPRAIDCSKFAAIGYDQLGMGKDGVRRTKGAYSVLQDLVAALSGKVPDDNVVHYTLLLEQDLNLHPEIGEGKAKEILTRLKSPLG